MTLQPATIPWRLVKQFCRLRTAASTVPSGGISGFRKQAFASTNPRWKVATQHSDEESRPTCWSFLSPSTLEITAAINSVSIRKSTIRSESIPLLAILVTPSHIKLLDHGVGFIPSLLRHVFQLTNDGQNLDVLAAVVDRIPYPITSGGPLKRSARPNSAADKISERPIEDGSEGISFVVLDSVAAAPNLWSPQTQPEERETMSIQQRCTLSFALPPIAAPVPSLSSEKEKFQPLVSRMLQLPVANTLFQNGKTATLIAERWRTEQSTEPSFALSCIRETSLPRQTLRMTDAFSNQSTGFDQNLASRLIPITPTRTIKAAVGNIIRKISIDSASVEGVPASQELERAISSALKEDRFPAQHAGIWALLRPPSYTFPSAQTVDSTDEVNGNAEIQEAILNGCHLHKVLSGGGGWGEKQGLLALDPDYDYSTNQKTFETLLEVDVDADVESVKLQGLGEIVSPGDTVKFYVYQPPPYYESPSVPNTNTPEATKTLSMSFGSLPSTMDTMPNLSGNETKDTVKATCTITKDHFGMLSEQGMSLQSRFIDTDLRASRVKYLVPKLLDQGLPPYEMLNETIMTTKLDSPHTTFSIREEVQPLSLGNKAAGGGSQQPNLKSKNFPLQQPIEAKSTVEDHKEEDSIAETSTSLDDFLEAMISMPSHQHVSTARTGRQSRTQGKPTGQEPSSDLLTINGRAAALRRLPLGYPLIRKHKKTGPEEGAFNVPLSQLKQVQSNIHNAEETSRKSDGTNDQLQEQQHDMAMISNGIESAGQEPETNDGIAQSGRMTAVSERQPVRRANRGTRIHKHVTNMPVLLGARLSKSARRKIVEEWTSGNGHATLVKSIVEGNPESPGQDRKYQAWESENKDRNILRVGAKKKPVAPKIRFVAEESKTRLDWRQTLSTPQDVPAKQDRPLYGGVIRQLRVSEAPAVKVRKHIAVMDPVKARLDVRSRYNHKLEALRKSREVKERTRKVKMKTLYRNDPTWDKLRADKEPTMLQIKNHQSEELAPADAREKASRLHRNYYMPLLDQSSGEAPRP